MFIVTGTYRFAPKLVAYRNDWCNHCNFAVLSQQWRSFYVGHVYWIPFLPLGFYKTWRCKICGNDPRERTRTAVGIIVAGLLTFSLGFLITFAVPHSGDEAILVWGLRLLFGSLALAFAYWLRSRLKESPPERIVEPLRNDDCLICGGRMTDYPRWHCVDCGVIRHTEPQS
jgi:hypothetical protein